MLVKLGMPRASGPRHNVGRRFLPNFGEVCQRCLPALLQAKSQGIRAISCLSLVTLH